MGIAYGGAYVVESVDGLDILGSHYHQMDSPYSEDNAVVAVDFSVDNHPGEESSLYPSFPVAHYCIAVLFFD
jgi:hypothetical protein